MLPTFENNFASVRIEFVFSARWRSLFWNPMARTFKHQNISFNNSYFRKRTRTNRSPVYGSLQAFNDKRCFFVPKFSCIILHESFVSLINLLLAHDKLMKSTKKIICKGVVFTEGQTRGTFTGPSTDTGGDNTWAKQLEQITFEQDKRTQRELWTLWNMNYGMTQPTTKPR